MDQPDRRDEEISALRERLARLGEASLRINESLDFDAVLQGVLDSARDLARARYGAIILLDDAGQAEAVLASGLTLGETERLWKVPDAAWFFERLGRIPGPLRVPDLPGYLASQGLADPGLPVPAGPFLAAPVTNLGRSVATVYLAREESGPEFVEDDLETLVMFASQAAMVIANARRHREERWARADLETLVDTSPVGVVVFDAGTGAPVSSTLADAGLLARVSVRSDQRGGKGVLLFAGAVRTSARLAQLPTTRPPHLSCRQACRQNGLIIQVAWAKSSPHHARTGQRSYGWDRWNKNRAS